MIRACLAIALLCMATPVIGQVIDTNFVEIPSAKRQGELPLPSVSDQIEDREQWMKQGELTHVRNVSRPTLLPVLPDQNASGAALIIAPGGAFLGLAIDQRRLAGCELAGGSWRGGICPEVLDEDDTA